MNPNNTSPISIHGLLACFLAFCFFGLNSYAETFNNPIFSNKVSADPAFILVDGQYYFADPYSNPIRVYKSDRITQIDGGSSAAINLSSDPNVGFNRWAPEISFWNGRFYIYFSATNAAGNNRQTAVFQSDSGNALGTYTLKNPALTSRIDFSLFTRSDGTLWGVFGYGNVRIRKMKNPWTFDGPEVVIASADQSWENGIMEGPFVFERNGKVFISYSGSNWNTNNYALGLLSFTGDANDDLADASKWVKSIGSVFAAANGISGPGHNSVVLSPDGTDYWNIFHYRQSAGGDGRRIRAQIIDWNSDGTPDFGVPLTGPLTVPSGEGVTIPNQAPTNISLTNYTIDENQALGTRIGYLITEDPNGGDSHIYALSGADSSAFELDGNQLVSSVAFDFESKSSYSVSVQSTDGRGLQFSKTLIITVNNLLESGRGIPTTVADFKFTGGSLDSSDADPTTSADLASGGGAGYFITGTSSQYLRSTTTDNNPNSSTAKRDNGQYVSVTLTAQIGKSLNLESFSMRGRRGGDSPDRLTVFATPDGVNFYTLISNKSVSSSSVFGSYSNTDLASIAQLQDASSVEFRIVYHSGSTGLTGGWNESDDIQVVAGVIDAGSTGPGNNAPTNVTLSSGGVEENQPSGSPVGTLSTSDPDSGDSHSYTLIGGDVSAFSINGNQLKTAASFDYESQSSYSVTIRTTDSGGLFYQKAFTISVTDVAEGGSTGLDGSGNVTLGGDGSSFANQDLAGTTTIGGGGASATLTGNNWKRFPINYTVTADTMLEFTVESSDTGEIIGVGLDENNDLSDAVRIFQVGGSQNWTGGQPISPSYTAGEGAVTYVIPVGSYYTGAMNWLVLAADDDANASTNVTYSNIKIYEAGGGGGNTLAISADSYVVSGSASSNYGSDSNLLVKDSDSNNFDRATYIKADVSSLGSDATQATLVLTVSGIGGESAVNRPVNLYALSNDSWSESAITWNNRPAKGNLLVSAMITSADVGNEIAFDVTDLINGERAGDGTVSFVLEQPGSANALVRFGSRESATPPVLEIGGGGGGGVPATLAEYTFGSGSLASSDADGESSASAVSSGGGSGYVLSAGEVSGRLRATTSDNNPNGNDAKLNNGQYATFTITANSGKSLNIDSFSLSTRREGNSPDRLTVYASGDGGGSFVTVFENQYVPTSSAFATKDDLSLATVSELQGVSSVEFRIVYHAGSTGLTNGRDDTDDIEVIGSVVD